MSTDPSPRPDVLHVDPQQLRDSIRISVDRELLDQLDRQRGSVSRSEYLEMVLAAALSRPEPHLPEDWTPERAAEQRYERLQRYLATGR
jgi:metal-responsive CopG/Arc/MetJ family transcriptional regulator